ncbi:TadE/TadG family type IV pilus assembly protein [Bradyrhizobium oligotrophicum]|uniref:TadE/TadG family type IV pilus assembly protein n=1 Tax=Bradyrhizobium oligotrophicum TaxID=44255 RepID=UPI003EC04B05
MLARLSPRVRNLRTNTDAVAATEFAIVLPFMLTLYLGGVELGNGLAIGVKVSETSHSVADMVSQNTQITATQMLGILQASTAIMAPYAVKDDKGNSLMTVTVSEISTDKDGNATVQWSESTVAASKRKKGDKMTLSAFTTTSPTNANISLILGEVSYNYRPNLGSGVTGPVTISDSYYLFPRCSTNSPATSSFPYYDVKYPASATCTCIQHMRLKTC